MKSLFKRFSEQETKTIIKQLIKDYHCTLPFSETSIINQGAIIALEELCAILFGEELQNEPNLNSEEQLELNFS